MAKIANEIHPPTLPAFPAFKSRLREPNFPLFFLPDPASLYFFSEVEPRLPLAALCFPFRSHVRQRRCPDNRHVGLTLIGEVRLISGAQHRPTLPGLFPEDFPR